MSIKIIHAIYAYIFVYRKKKKRCFAPFNVVCVMKSRAALWKLYRLSMWNRLHRFFIFEILSVDMPCSNVSAVSGEWWWWVGLGWVGFYVFFNKLPDSRKRFISMDLEARSSNLKMFLWICSMLVITLLEKWYKYYLTFINFSFFVGLSTEAMSLLSIQRYTK